MPGICTTIQRDGESVDIYIDFASRCTSGGFAGDYFHPPEPAEFEFDFEDANEDVGGGKLLPLKEDELEQVRRWFEDDAAAFEKCWEAAVEFHNDPDYDDY